MTKRFLLPIASFAVLTLAACSDSSDAPDMPDPDAGTPTTSEPAPDEAATPSDEVTSAEEIARRREEIEQEANAAFDSIMDETRETVDEIGAAGTSAMQSVTSQLESVGGTFQDQFDTIIENVEAMRDENMSETQKIEVVANARVAAEQAARAFNQTDAEVVAAGDRAEAAARNAMGL